MSELSKSKNIRVADAFTFSLFTITSYFRQNRQVGSSEK